MASALARILGVAVLAGAAVTHYQLVAVVHNVDGALAVMPPQGLQRSDPSLLKGDIRAAVTARRIARRCAVTCIPCFRRSSAPTVCMPKF
jgi:hypothetical protein